MLSCTAQGAEWLGTCGQGRHLPCSGGPLGAPRPSTAKRRAVVPVLPVPDLLRPQHLLHSGSASWTLGQPRAAALTRGQEESAATLGPAKPGRGHCPWACRHHPPPWDSLSSHPSSPISFWPSLPHSALQHLWGRDGSSGAVVSLAAETCCPR